MKYTLGMNKILTQKYFMNINHHLKSCNMGKNCENTIIITNLKKIKLLVPSLVWFDGISTFVGYLMPKPFSKKNSGGAI